MAVNRGLHPANQYHPAIRCVADHVTIIWNRLVAGNCEHIEAKRCSSIDQLSDRVADERTIHWIGIDMMVQISAQHAPKVTAAGTPHNGESTLRRILSRHTHAFRCPR